MFASRRQAAKAYALWKKQDWAELEKMMGPGNWPPNRGFITASKITLLLGTKLDRYGGWFANDRFNDTGTFLSPAGASFESRALPANTLEKPYSKYIVLKSFDVDTGQAIPWFGQKGMGVQYETDEYVQNLIDQVVIKNYGQKSKKFRQKS